MIQIDCPFCGVRGGAEFVYERSEDSVVKLDAAPDAAVARLYARANPKGWSWELWRHAYGCRGWIRLRRHTVTQEIAETMLIGGLP